MPLNWTTGELMRPAGCLPCCNDVTPPPVVCDCEYYFYDFNNPPGPGGNPNPFGNVAGAQAWIDNYTANCALVASRNNSVFSGVNIAVSQVDLSMNTAFITPSLNVAYTDVLFGFSAPAGTTVNFSIQNFASDGNTATNYAVTFGLVDCNGASINPDSGDANYSVFTVPDVNPIRATMSIFGYENSTYANAGLRIDPNSNIYLTPAIALWDDSGTTRKLWACPKLSVPLNTETSGDWFADCATAASYMAASVIDCLVAEELVDSVSDGGSATGGSSLSVDETVHNNAPYNSINPHFALYASINLTAGESVDITYSVTGDGNEPADNFTFLATITGDDIGTSPTAGDTGASATPISGTKTFATFSGFPPAPTTWTAPYSGRYFVAIDVIGPRKDSGGGTYVVSSLTGTFTIASSGTMSVNEAQALYDIGLDCPARLNCGDSCP